MKAQPESIDEFAPGGTRLNHPGSWRCTEYSMRLAPSIPVSLVLLLIAGWAHGGTFSVFGPNTYQRETGAPVLETATFDVANPGVPYTLIIYNGGLEDDPERGEFVSSSDIYLNGSLVVGPSQFNQNVERVEVPVTLLAHNEIGIELRGKPGGQIAVEIVGIDDEAPTLVIASPADGASLDTAALTFAVNYSDSVSGIDLSTLVISIDGVDATDLFEIGDTSAQYPATLGDGQHSISVSVRDRAGNSAAATSTFTVATAIDLVSKPRAVPNSGEAPLTVRFIPEFETNTAIERFDWDFQGDGIFDRSEVIGRNQTFTYNEPGTYNAVLRITDSNGEQASGTAVVVVGNAPPEITAEASPSNGQIPLLVSFSAIASDSEGIALYEWDFDGDGSFDFSSPSSGNTSFTYTEAGTFQAVVRVTDALGASATLALPTTEVRSASPGAPSVTATANPTSGTVPLAVSFNASATDPDGQAFTEWAWDFDGDDVFDQVGTSPAAGFTYSAPGVYFAKVRVTAADGDTADDFVQVSVQPSLSLSVSVDTIDPGFESASVQTVLGGDTRVSLVIESRNGEVVRTLVPWTTRAAGTYNDLWSGKSDENATVAEGDYYAVLLFEVDGVVDRLDLRQTSGGSSFNPPRSTMPSRFQPFDDNPLTITYTLSRAAEVTAFMGRFNVNARLVTFLERHPQGRGSHSIVWNGENGDGQLIHPPPGDRFLFGIFAFTLADNAIYVHSGAQVGAVRAEPSIFNPTEHSDDQGTPRRSTISFSLSRSADVELIIANADTGAELDRLLYSELAAGANAIEWDGRTSDGLFVAPGRYRLGVSAIDASGFRSIAVYTLQRIYY